MNKIRDKKGGITTDLGGSGNCNTDIKNLYSTKLKNLKEMGKFLDI